MKKRILYTGGTFDLFHAGHVNFLKQCSEIADIVVVALNRDEFCESYKRRPVMSFEERRDCVATCKYVSLVVRNVGDEDSRVTIQGLGPVQPSIVAIGDDWKDRDYYKQMGFTQEWLDMMGIEVKYLPYTPGVSTTEIIDRIQNRQQTC